VEAKGWSPPVKVQLVGARPSQYLDQLKALIHRLGVEDRVCVTGWVPAEDVLANVRQADVCCVPHHSNPHTDTTMPHKLYQYMMAGKPLLVSSSGPLARTVRQANAGVVFQAGDSADCAHKILELLQHPDRRSAYGASGYDYVMGQGHNWENES